MADPTADRKPSNRGGTRQSTTETLLKQNYFKK